jgi:hypothetical protein
MDIETRADKLTDAIINQLSIDRGAVRSHLRDIILASFAVEAMEQQPVADAEAPESEPARPLSKARRGRVWVASFREEEELEALRAALEGCAVTRCEYMHHAAAFEVYAAHPDFEEVQLGRLIPEYRAIMENDEDGQPRRVRFEKA